MWTFTKKAAPALTLAGIVSSLCTPLLVEASEEIRLAQVGGATQDGTLSVSVPAGGRVELEATVLVDGREDDNASAALTWHVQCAPEAVCAPDAFTPTARGQSFQVPEGDFSDIQIVVGGGGEQAMFDLHNSADSPLGNGSGSEPTQARTHRFHNPSAENGASPSALPLNPLDASGTGTGRHHGGRGFRDHSADAGAAAGVDGSSPGFAAGYGPAVGGAAGPDTSGSSSSSGNSVGTQAHAASGGSVISSSYDGNTYSQVPYGSDMGSSASAGGVALKVAPLEVVSCAKVRGGDGQLHIQCEDPHAAKLAKTRIKGKATPVKVPARLEQARKAALLAAAKRKRSVPARRPAPSPKRDLAFVAPVRSAPVQLVASASSRNQK